MCCLWKLMFGVGTHQIIGVGMPFTALVKVCDDDVRLMKTRRCVYRCIRTPVRELCVGRVELWGMCLFRGFEMSVRAFVVGPHVRRCFKQGKPLVILQVGNCVEASSTSEERENG